MLLKRFACPVCGATGPLPTRSPFLECEACHTISDFDWGIARDLAEWPAHQELSQRLFGERRHAFETDGKAGDVVAWTQAYAEVLAQLVAAFPTIYPARISEPGYCRHFIAFQAAHEARLVLNPELVANQRRINHASMAIEYKHQRAVLESLWRAMELSLAHFDAQDRLARDTAPGLPPDFAAGYMRQIGISMTVQEWLPRLEQADRLELVRRLGVAHQYVDPAGELHCNTCGAELSPLGDGEIRTRCPYCNADLHAQHAGPRADAQRAGDFEFISSELAQSLAEHNHPLEAIEVLDGTTGHPPQRTYRLVMLRAWYADRVDPFFEVTDDPESENIANALAWAAHEASQRGVELRRVPYREHPACWKLPRDAAELQHRLLEMLPSAAQAQIMRSVHGDGFTYECVVDGVHVRLAIDPKGKRPLL
jgi:hypothetical protein